MTCGAKTRSGAPCKQKSIYSNGRCKHHGGMATGPTTEAGKEQARINGKKGGRPRKSAGVETEPQEIPKITQGMEGGSSVSTTSGAVGNVLVRVTDQPESEAKKPKSMGCREKLRFDEPKSPDEMSKDAHVSDVRMHRCADCQNLSANWICQAAARGEIEGGADYRPTLGEKHNCRAFAHWKT